MKREREIDIMKGIAIVLMVLGHSGFAGEKFIYLFHMAVFFMISGYLYKPDYEGGVKGIVKYVIKKIKSLWLPYFVWNSVFTLLNNFLIKCHVYSDESLVVAGTVIEKHAYMGMADMAKNILKGVAMLGRTELGGAFWFLRTLFALSILFCVIEVLLYQVIRKQHTRNIVQLIIAVVLSALGYVAHLLQISNVSVPVVLSSYVLYYFGYLLKQYRIMTYIPKIPGVLLSLLILLLCNFFGPSISLGNNSFWNPIYLIVCAFAGWCFCFGLAEVLKTIVVGNIFEYMGKNTLPIVIHHFGCFKIVTMLQIGIYDLPIKGLAAFPYLDATKCWWIVYAIVGIVVPIMLQQLWDFGCKICKEKVSNRERIS